MSETVFDIFPVASDRLEGLVVYSSRAEPELTVSEILDALPAIYGASPRAGTSGDLKG